MSQAGEPCRRIVDLVAEYHRAAFVPRRFVPGASPVRYVSRVLKKEPINFDD